MVWGIALLAVAGLGAKWIVTAAGGPAAAARSEVALRRQASGPGAGGGPAARKVFVQITGSVRHPGVYSLPAGSRVFEAIKVAGGFARGGDPDAVALAARVVDGARIEIPKRAALRARATAGPSSAVGSPMAEATAPAVADAPQGPVSLASATLEQLDRLDGIGPALARRIIEWRDAHGGFGSVADLDRVPGIGPAKLAALRSATVP